jgi:hypothetical protein
MTDRLLEITSDMIKGMTDRELRQLKKAINELLHWRKLERGTDDYLQLKEKKE